MKFGNLVFKLFVNVLQRQCENIQFQANYMYTCILGIIITGQLPTLIKLKSSHKMGEKGNKVSLSPISFEFMVFM